MLYLSNLNHWQSHSYKLAAVKKAVWSIECSLTHAQNLAQDLRSYGCRYVSIAYSKYKGCQTACVVFRCERDRLQALAQSFSFKDKTAKYHYTNIVNGTTYGLGKMCKSL